MMIHHQLPGENKEKAVELLGSQLREISRVVPSAALEKLREVKLWFSPEYPDLPPRAEYHPNAGWLVANQRNPAMAKGVEFTNIAHFEAECRRMPAMVLHELAHAYHDRVLGFDHPQIEAAYRHAKTSGRYDQVQRVHGGQRPASLERAYAMASAREYFAETSEAFFHQNDFFPFTRGELEKHDPEMAALLERLWNPDVAQPSLFPVTPPPSALNAPPFYRKYISAGGYPIVASEKVNDYALREAAYLVNLMLARRPDVREAMIRDGSRLSIMAHDEFTTDLPEWAHLSPAPFWNRRARGMGGSPTDPFCSCAEENLLGFPGDPYKAENILIHEFAHNIHLRGMAHVDATFDTRVKAAFEASMALGLWKGKYASVNHHEYFAEGVQSWFDNNREDDHDHNHVNTRAELFEYDPGLAALCRELFGETELKYTQPASRLRDHLAGYDPTGAPTFRWPKPPATEEAARATPSSR